MRVPHNEPLDEPERRCILTGARAPRASLIRLALGPDGQVAPDVRARAPGRGAWIGVARPELEIALDKGKLKGALSRAFKTNVVTPPEDLGAKTENALARHALDRLGLEARAGTLLTGSDRIDQSAREGKVKLLLHAADAREDGCRKLDQAWRVGSGREGTPFSGVMLAADRDQLSAALGRVNVVHIAITDLGAAARVGEAVDRWHRFIGRETSASLAESRRKVQGDAAHDVEDRKLGTGNE